MLIKFNLFCETFLEMLLRPTLSQYEPSEPFTLLFLPEYIITIQKLILC